ncbi:MAG: YlxR family protein [Tissierellia bacterium]|nr:YlxR family protein [Tissierellia bacterium]
MKKQKKTPIRKCIGCGKAQAKHDLIRVVKNKDNEVFLDLSGKANGRGAYLCKDQACLERAMTLKALNRAFGMEISQDTYEALINTLKNDSDEPL